METHDAQTANHADENAIRDLFTELIEDWGRGDGEAYGALFTEDADYIAFEGTHTKEREEIASSHQELFDTHLKGTRLTGRIESIRFLAPDVALVHATGGTVKRGGSEPSPERDSIQTLVAVKCGEQWRFTAFHNCRVRPISRGFAALLVWATSDLLWKVLVAGRKGA